MKIIGYTVGTPLPKPNMAQTDYTQGDYVKNKEALDNRYYTEEEIDSKLVVLQDSKADVDIVTNLSNIVSTNYDESIIGLSVDGRTVTYIKGNGSVHTFETQDSDTTYSLATDETTGLTKLYATTGNAEDGTMTQKAIKTELDKKVGVTIDGSNDMLIFTI